MTYSSSLVEAMLSDSLNLGLGLGLYNHIDSNSNSSSSSSNSSSSSSSSGSKGSSVDVTFLLISSMLPLLMSCFDVKIRFMLSLSICETPS
jgi:hypothetical protein